MKTIDECCCVFYTYTMFRIQKSIFVIIDAQNFCVKRHDDEGGLRAAADNIKLLLNDARKTAAMPVFHVAMSTLDAGSGKCFRYCPQDFLMAHNALSLIEGCEPQGHEGLFLKVDFSSFSNPAFLHELRAFECERIYLCGFHTGACVEQTALDALQNGFNVFVIKGATASPGATRTEHGLKNIRDAGGTIISVEEFRRVLYPENPIYLGPNNPHFSPN